MFTWKNTLLVVVALASQTGMNPIVLGQAPQNWAAMPATEKPAAGESSRVSAMFKGKEAVDPVIIKRYVQNDMARFTNVTAETDTSTFAQIRFTLMSTIRSAASDPAKKAAAEQVVALAKVIAASARFHNAARINSMVALTELDLASNSPFPGTYKELLASAKDEALPLHLRSIALYGLNRHARFSGLKDAGKDQLAKDMTAIISTQPKSPIDVKAHAWMVRRGFDVLSTLGANHAVEPAIARLLDDKELPSLRLAAADYLPRVDQSKLKLTDEQKIQYFVGLAQLLEQQLVMWYEFEEDALNMKSGAAAGGMMGGGMEGMGMGGMDGGMGMGGDGYGSGGGMGGMEGGMGGMEGMGMGGMGMGGMGEGGMGMGMGMGSGGMGATGPKPKPLETQPWEVRMTRRKVNQILQTVHVALDGKPIKGGRPVSAVGKGLIDLELPAEISTPASELLKGVESLQNRINDSTKITTMQTLISQTKKLIERIMDQVREVPALTAQYPKYQQKKEDLNEVLEQPKANPPAGEGTEPAVPATGTEGDAPGEPTVGAPAGAEVPAAGAPAAGAPAAPAPKR